MTEGSMEQERIQAWKERENQSW